MAATEARPAAAYSLREQRAWYWYDWANSAYYTTVVGVLLGPYLTALARNAADSEGFVYPFGIPVAAISVWGYAISLSVLSQVIALPVAGALADYGRRKRRMLGVLAFTGSAATLGMFFLDQSRYQLGVALFLIANLSFGASIVVYNSFLPEIAAPDDRDRVSSKGWGFGYLGGGLLLALNLGLYSNAASFGISESFAVRISLASAGIWWASFTIIPLLGLRDRGPGKHTDPGVSPLRAALRQLRRTLSEIRNYPQTLLFLVAYLLFNDAVQTVIAMAVQFGSEDLKMSMADLTKAILLVQFVAFMGALAFNVISARIGNKRALMLGLVIWTATLIYIYFAVRTVTDFFFVAGVIGLVLGGTQALSRSIFSLMIPEGREAEYFSVYELSDKGTSWLGPLLFGLALQWTHSFRIAIVSLIVFFVAGLALLVRVDVRRATIEAGNVPPQPVNH